MRYAWRIALKDALEARRDGRFRVAALLLGLVLLVSVVTGWSTMAGERRARDAAQQTERALWVAKGEMNPHAAAHFGAFVFKPVHPLSAVDPGLDPFLGTSVFLEAHQQELAQHTPADDASPMTRWSTLTAAVALQALAPLLILVAVAPAFVRERELGTLRQLASAGVPRATLIAGKLIGAVLPLAVVLLPAAGLGVLIAFQSQDLPAAPDAGARAAWMLAAYTAYFVIWASIGLVISARSRSSGVALSAACAAWVLVVVIAPSMALAASGSRTAGTSGAAFAEAIETARLALPVWTARVADVEERFLSGALDLSPGLPSNPEVVALIEAEADETALYEREISRVSATHREQSRAYAGWGLLAPSVAMQTLSMGLAGTNAEYHWRFLDAAAAYRRRFLETLNAELASYTALDTFDFVRGKDFWTAIPEFSFETPATADLLVEQRPAALALAAWVAASAGLLLWSLRTLRVTSTAQ